MRLRAVALLALLALAMSAAPAAAKPRHAKRLKAFDSCTSLVSYATRHAPRTPPPPLSAPAPMPVGGEEDSGAGPDTSQTNVQEAGVDEPDSVKTDGERIYALANGR